MFKKFLNGNNIFEVEYLKKIKKRKYLKKSLKIFIILSILWVFAFYLYNTYQKIEINDNYVATRTQSTLKEQTVENVQDNSQKIADVLEETTQKVVGISKLKDTGNSILLKSSENELGLGTGVIVTEDGYIVSNEHVTGSKYSRCYITLENGTNYDGTVVWSDSDLDLSITKINEKNLPYVTLGDSKSIRVGETVYAIRKSYWI